VRIVNQVTKHFLLFIGIGLFLLLLGIGGFCFIFFRGVSDPEALVGSVVCFFGGIGFLWQMVKPLPKNVPKNKLDICPFCGAIIEKNATLCTKCKKQLTE